MFKYKLILFITVLLGCLNTNAQNETITGNITDDKGAPLIGVNVIIVSENNRFVSGATSDFDGTYNISYDKKYNTIRFSFIGFKSQTLKIDGQSTIDVVMVEDITTIDEIVLHGKAKNVSNSGIMEVPFKDLTTANQKLKMGELSEVGAATLGDALQGQLTNVDMTFASGSPGAGMSIRIRGTSSLNASQEPLIVLDGVIYPTNIQDDFDFQTADANDYGSLVDIAPEDIESIEVLKDAGATALYGTKGANGVLVITSRRGRRGPTRFNYSYKLKTRFLQDPIPMLEGDDYIALMNDALWNSYLDSEGSEGFINTLQDFPDINGDPDYVHYNEFNQNTDWVDLISQNSISHDHSLSISGGGEKARYRFSLGYLNDIGTTIGTDFNRLSTRANIDYEISDKLIFSTDFSYIVSNRNSIPKPNRALGESGESQVRSLAFYKMPNMNPYQFDETGNITNRYFTPNENFQNNTINPLAMVNEGQSELVANKIRSVFRFNYKISKALTIDSNISFDKNITKQNDFVPQIASGESYLSTTANEATENNGEGFTIQTNNKLTFRPYLGDKHRLISLLLLQTLETSSLAFNNRIGNTGHSNLTVPLSGGVVGAIGNGSSKRRDVGALLNTHYTFNDKYILSAGIRADGSSKFGADKRYAYFPNGSIAYRLSSEKFMENVSWVDDIKFRVSYAQVGNSPATAYPSFGSYGTNGFYLNQQALAPQSITLDNLKWELTKSVNFGANFSLLNNSLNLTFDYYVRKTEDLLVPNVTLPETTGFSRIGWVNQGDMENRGVEFSGFWQLINNKNLRFQINWNLARNKNIQLSLPENIATQNYTYANGSYATRIEIGKPVGSFYGYRSLGVFTDDNAAIATDQNGNPLTNPEGELVYLKSANGITFRGGDAKYQDINYDGVIDENDIVYLGNNRPLVTGGFGPSITYKSFSLNTFFHFRLGHKIINETRINTENMRGTNNQSTAVLSRWRKPGDVTDVPRALFGRGFNYLGSDRFVEDGSYVRLKNITLAYRLPHSICEKLKVKQLSAYATGYDLFTWTKYSGQDPEVGLNGRDRATTPRPAMLNLGINIGF
ncbi:SusC/RagA family TonB-linked outer membrane protein [Tamlana sp. 2201CG12-4]|uniref:SusC/RagA family TonB-linked outer membrane protein n=1 Tax=Tamlana sp. 2201CG12-4 TaxID=3112582 RepID=UPI002DB69695|nr:SusC/RagA family TonB-linked outer membrane protein [Tamlana sp. 2201CG12-4]MEC3907209.1 SusC/RagA family TonB-linked outer membrane protein [Tamlana sp. 2201CG12-4]